MPVYLLTIHTYRSWSEDHPKGYIQRDEGLQPPDPDRARWRRDHTRHEPVRLDRAQQRIAHAVIDEITPEFAVTLHARATTPTHAHVLHSFRSPACTCGASRHCQRGCPARAYVEKLATRLKRKLGQQLARSAQTVGQRGLSRGWDITPVRDKPHLDYLTDEYLPEHETNQGGIFKRDS